MLHFVASYLPLKKRRVMFSEGNAAHPVGCDSLLQIVIAIWRIFFEFELAGLGVEARCWLYWLFGALQI
jgi:hypothetical protein